MPEPARSDIVEPDESGTIQLHIGVTTGAFYVDGPDEHGVVRLVPTMSHEEISARLGANAEFAARVAADEADPSRMVARPTRPG